MGQPGVGVVQLGGVGQPGGRCGSAGGEGWVSWGGRGGSARGGGVGQHGGRYASCVHAGGLSFSNWSYPVLTTTQNDEKLHIFYSNSLVILSIWAHYAWRDMYR